ncbi:fc7730d7-6170-4a77-9a98-5bf3c862f76c [Sclerotinia trifoliorum]|uniref:Dipeptidyl-peptidase V n=1 Tax=Sclerotinia trifoliorum TaxID=28548 RepID=A0A8H2W047_9HELO|nr:fc7730d7-6170-4a77-9a98-5bf3c862f76c [Sclerotinia trifoliorum]
MTIRVNSSIFTPEVLISTPRRSSATPNADGKLALYTVSTYSFQSHSKSSRINVLDIGTGESSTLSDDASDSEPVWLGWKNEVLWLRSGEKGSTHLVLADADNPGKKPKIVTTFDGAISNIKLTALAPDVVAIAVTGLVTPTGKLYNAETAKKPLSTAKAYSKLFVREWDSWVTENKNAIWYATITKGRDSDDVHFSGLVNALAGHKISLESPVPPFGGTGDFDISKNGIVFVAKDPNINPANYTKTDLYYIPLKTFTESGAPTPQLVETGNLKGYSLGPVWSPDAKSVIFTRMKNIQYETDKTRLLLIPDITDLTNVQEFFETEDGKGGWDLKPENVTFSRDGKEIYITAEENGRVKLFKLPASPRHATKLPEALTSNGTVTDKHVLPSGELFFSGNSLIDNSVYSIIDPGEPSKKITVSSSSDEGRAFGLSQKQVDEFWFTGAEDYKVHAWVFRPSNFDENKKYPLAYLIHGGPQGAWNEGWSTRWNPAVFAEQGYVVVTPNPTGSSGYGMALQDGIKGQWGGRPYIDLVKGFEYIEKNLSYVDTNRAVACGASYGGFMVNWIQGHDLGRKFKALVTHDGVFSTLNQYASEELFFPHHDFEGTLWDNPEGYQKWNPASHTANWQTPHLIIHNDLDYRLPISEGLAPFNVLQTRGVESRFLTFPDENHWVLKPENSRVWHKEVFDWINKYSGITKENEELRREIEKLSVI